MAAPLKQSDRGQASSGQDQPDPAPTPADNAWAVKIGVVAGIPIRLHFTFLLFLLYVGVAGQRIGLSILYVLALFTCVVLHELGHSIVALKYKIPVSDITLYPIGGVARIEKRPTARQELAIAVAGPLVNVVLALLIWAGLGFESGPALIAHLTASGMGAGARAFAERVMLANITLVLFNLIPAFPMDGGRVLRAILAMNMPGDRATAIASGVGQLIAIAAGLLAFLSHPPNWSLIFIAFFVYLGAGQEAFAYKQEALLEGVRVREAMMTDIRTLQVGNSLKEAADVLLDTSQHDFPVVLGTEVQGVLTRDGLLRGLADAGPGAYVAGVMRREFAVAHPEDNLGEVLPRLQAIPGPLVILEPETNTLAGMVTTENVQEFFALRQIAAARSRRVMPPPARRF